MAAMALSGTGLFTPAASISNDELVAAFNEYVRRHNRAHAQAIAEGTVAALQESSTEFVTKASGIENRYVMDKAGILDPDIMCPRIPERSNDKISILAEMAVTAARDALKAADRTVADIDGVLVACSNLQRAYPVSRHVVHANPQKEVSLHRNRYRLHASQSGLQHLRIRHLIHVDRHLRTL